MKTYRSALVFLALAAWVVSGCGQSPTVAATPQPSTKVPVEVATATLQPPTKVPVEVATVTPTAVARPTADVELPELLAHLHWLGHASFRFDGPPTIYFDPVSVESDAPQADIVLVSHEHSDHYAPATLRQISRPETVIVTNKDIAAKLEKESLGCEVRALQPGERTTVGDVEIEAVPAYNVTKSYHPKAAGWLGFIVVWGGERLYFAGDTDRIPEMADIRCDVALLPVGGTYTMDVQEAAQAAADIKPRVVVPMHDRGANLEQFRSLCNCTVVIMKE